MPSKISITSNSVTSPDASRLSVIRTTTGTSSIKILIPSSKLICAVIKQVKQVNLETSSRAVPISWQLWTLNTCSFLTSRDEKSGFYWAFVDVDVEQTVVETIEVIAKIVVVDEVVRYFPLTRVEIGSSYFLIDRLIEASYVQLVVHCVNSNDWVSKWSWFWISTAS